MPTDSTLRREVVGRMRKAVYEIYGVDGNTVIFRLLTEHDASEVAVALVQEERKARGHVVNCECCDEYIESVTGHFCVADSCNYRAERLHPYIDSRCAPPDKSGGNGE